MSDHTPFLTIFPGCAGMAGAAGEGALKYRLRFEMDPAAFPAEQQNQVRTQLSMVLRAVVSQRLLLGTDGTLYPVFEVMTVNPAIQNLIREGKTPQMYSSMLSSANLGAITMDNCLLNMASKGVIDRETALEAGNDKDYLRKKMMM